MYICVCIYDVSKLDIKGYKIGVSNIGPDKIYNTTTKFAEHPSILKIKQMIHTKNKFTFSMSNVADITMEINNLNINKPTTFNNIPAKLIVE